MVPTAIGCRRLEEMGQWVAAKSCCRLCHVGACPEPSLRLDVGPDRWALEFCCRASAFVGLTGLGLARCGPTTPPPPWGMGAWAGDFSTGDLSQWTGSESVDKASRLMVVDAPMRPGSRALKVLLRHADVVQNGVRAEVFRQDNLPDGSERWYQWSVLFPSDFPVSLGWQVWTQWHQSYRPDGTTLGAAPPVAFAIRDDRLCLVVTSVAGADKELWTSPIPRGRWLDLVLRAKWSATAGFLELWVDGEQALPKTQLATTFPGLSNYLKLGLYRASKIAEDATIYHSGMTISDDPPPPAAVAHPRFRVQAADGRWWVLELKPEAP